jgi:hypothetical protein
MKLVNCALMMSFLAAPVVAATEPTAIDVCQRIPGADIARLFGNRLKDTKPAAVAGEFSRCTYLVTDAAGKSIPGYSLWLYPASEYEALLEYTEGIVEKPQGFGDAAVLFHDEDGLFKLRFVVGSQYALEAVASDAEAVKKLARHALGALSR